MKRTDVAHRVLFSLLLGSLLALYAAPDAQAQANQDAKIQSAMSAAPPSISEQATIRDWPAEDGGEMPLLREGSSAWTCLPDMPNTPGNDPMCLDVPWLKWADAWMNKTEPNITKMGFGSCCREGHPRATPIRTPPVLPPTTSG